MMEDFSGDHQKSLDNLEETPNSSEFKLLKVSKTLAQTWMDMSLSSISSCTIVGYLAQSEDGSGKSYVMPITNFNENNQSNIRYMYENNAGTNPCLHALSYKTHSPEATLTYLGKLPKNVIIKPAFDATYQSEIKKTLKESVIDKHRTQLNPNLSRTAEIAAGNSNYLFKYYQSPKNAELLDDDDDDDDKISTSHSQINQAPKLTAEQTKKAIFSIFEQHQNEGVRLKEFQNKINYPVAALKSLLYEIAEFKSINNERPEWHLRPEYRTARQI